MGAVGFVMAEFMCVSYTKVMLAAAIPAFLYYLSLLYSVHLEAKRLGLRPACPKKIFPRRARCSGSAAICLFRWLCCWR
ncbi:MAG: TRAP transporter large permease subunit [Oscillospiraceae bacterium]